MARIAYVNGRYVPMSSAAIAVEDRGLQFADSVYEVVAVAGGRLIDEDPHLDRLDRSLAEIRLSAPMSRPSLRRIMREVVRRNRIGSGMLYVQVTRGVARRDPIFPAHARPTVIMTARRMKPQEPKALAAGIAVECVLDPRWRRRDIKTVALLPNVLVRNAARAHGFADAWLVDDDGLVTEGTFSNAWIVTAKGQIVTRPKSQDILWGITRGVMLALAAELKLKLVERPFSVAEAKSASEAFITGATSFVTPVTRIDEAVLGSGTIGPVTKRLAERYAAHMAA
ncbi:MAG: D-amino-acid transaminase [Alphaproteobacteria bacterium]|nr:D-amino-acid transaminase [Alphaproteobacteria bacterium]